MVKRNEYVILICKREKDFMQKTKKDYFRNIEYKKLFACLAAFVFSSSVTASTLSTTIMNTKIINWNGIYIGGFGGGAGGSHITATEPVRLDNNAYWFRPFNNSFRFKPKTSFIGGATIGYNWQSCSSLFLLGLEGEYSYLTLRHSKTDPNQFPYANLLNNNLRNSSKNYVNIGKSNGYALLGARLGYVIDCLLFYIKPAIVFTRVQSKYNSVKTEDGLPAYLNLAGSKKIMAYGIGGGVEFALPFEKFANFSTKIEYLYLGFHKKQYVYGHCSCDFLWRNIQRIKGVNTIKVGINYKFG